MLEVGARARLILNLPQHTFQARMDSVDVVVGLRPAARLVVRHGFEVESIASALVASGVSVAVGRGVKHQRRNSVIQCIDWFSVESCSNESTESMAVLYIGMSTESAIAARSADESGDDERFGVTLGYPECCREFVRQRHGVPAISECFDLYAPRGHFEPWSWSATMALDAALLPHFPCEPFCANSIRFAKERWKIVTQFGSKVDCNRVRNAREATYWLESGGGVHFAKTEQDVPGSALKRAIPSEPWP